MVIIKLSLCRKCIVHSVAGVSLFGCQSSVFPPMGRSLPCMAVLGSYWLGYNSRDIILHCTTPQNMVEVTFLVIWYNPSCQERSSYPSFHLSFVSHDNNMPENNCSFELIHGPHSAHRSAQGSLSTPLQFTKSFQSLQYRYSRIQFIPCIPCYFFF